MNPSQLFVYTRTYSRWLPAEGRREFWPETVRRYIDFMSEEIPQTLKERERVYMALLNHEVMPSMRALWSAGPAAKKNNVTMYNCAFKAINDIRSFSEILFVLMSGAGAGFSVERQHIYQLPELQPSNRQKISIQVEDSREGWAVALDAALTTLFAGSTPVVDYSLVRPRGARLETMGGRASGPEPLQNLIDFACDLFAKRRKWGRLEPIDVHDLCCKIGEAVVVGGVRRSAEISLSDLEDRQMARAKQGEFWRENPHRSMANNSAVYPGKPDINTFMREWIRLMESGSGERGLFSRAGAKAQIAASGRRTVPFAIGVNPCQPASATVLTPTGIRTFADIDTGMLIWSGERWTRIVRKVFTGVKPTFKFHTRAGFFYGTEDHRVLSHGDKVPVKEADAIDIAVGVGGTIFNSPPLANVAHNIMDGLVLGDGTVHKASNNKVLLCIGTKDGDYFKSEVKDLIIRHRPGISKDNWEIDTSLSAKDLPKTYDRKIPKEYLQAYVPQAQGFLRGLFSANGSIAGERVTLKQASLDVILGVQQMLSGLGIRSYYTVNKSRLNKFSNGTYRMRESYDLNITRDRGEFRRQIGFIQKYKQEALDRICLISSNGKPKSTYDVMDVEYIGLEEVWDITVDDPAHTYWTGGLLVSNCGEILLRDAEFCNLTEIIIRSDDSLSDLREKVKIAAMLGCWQATFTEFPYLRKEWKKNCEEERLLGVSLTGIMDHPVLNHVNDEAKKWLGDLKHAAINEAKKWSRKLEIPIPAAITCVKPSGTVSQLVDSSSGIHQRYSENYIRRYRISATDPLFRLLRDQGVPCKPEVGQEPNTASTWVVEFPITAPKGAKTRHDFTAIQQLEHWKMVKDFWTEHNPSCTIYVGDDEWMKVGSWVFDNFDSLCGVSFLPKQNHVYQLAPYEEISREEYKKLNEQFPKINYTQLGQYEQEDFTEGAKSLACAGDRCEI